MNVESLMQELLGKPLDFNTIIEAPDDLRIYANMKYYVAAYKGKAYLFPMENIGEPDKNWGAYLAFALTADDIHKDDKLRETIKGFKPITEEASNAVQKVAGALHRWLSCDSEALKEINAKMAEMDKEDKPTLH